MDALIKNSGIISNSMSDYQILKSDSKWIPNTKIHAKREANWVWDEIQNWKKKLQYKR